MPTHKVANGFIRKYNKKFAIKGYSKLKLEDKLKLIESKTKARGGYIQNEWKGIMSGYKRPPRTNKPKTPTPKPFYTLAKPRPIGAVARPIRTKRPGAQHGGTKGASMGENYRK